VSRGRIEAPEDRLFGDVVKMVCGGRRQAMLSPRIVEPAGGGEGDGGAAVGGGAVKCCLRVACLLAEGKAASGVANGCVGKTGFGVGGGQEALGAEVIEKIADLEPVITGAMGGVDHALGVGVGALCRFNELPSDVVEFNSKPAMGALDVEWGLVGHGGAEARTAIIPT